VSVARGLRSGYYHENDQLSACATLTKCCVRVEDVRSLIPEFDRTFTTLTEGRAGPALFEVPVDVQRAAHPEAAFPSLPAAPAPLVPAQKEIEALADLLVSWRKPLLLAGGGGVSAGAAPLLLQLAERLGAPVFHTLNGKS